LPSIQRWDERWKARNKKEIEFSSLDDALTEAISEQLIGDVPIGVFLSGGCDSTLVSAIAQKLNSRPIHSFSLGFTKKDFDESKYALQASSELGTSHHAFKMDENDALEILPLVLKSYPEPLGDPSVFPTLFISREARKVVTAVLTGDGADELFFGYGRYSRFQELEKLGAQQESGRTFLQIATIFLLRLVTRVPFIKSTKLSRLAKSQINPKTGKPLIGSPANSLPKLLNGGGGLISTASDYARFSQMMLNSGELEGARILSRKSIELMTSNHLPPTVGFTNVVNLRWGSTGPTPAAGMGFGLGFAVRLENGRSTLPGSTGEFWWLGSTGTNFVIDPKEKMTLILLTQQPNRLLDYLKLMRQMGYAMLVD
jgi:hypothetical protein